MQHIIAGKHNVNCDICRKFVFYAKPFWLNFSFQENAQLKLLFSQIPGEANAPHFGQNMQNIWLQIFIAFLIVKSQHSFKNALACQMATNHFSTNVQLMLHICDIVFNE